MTDRTSETADEIETRLFLEAIHARYGYDLREYSSKSIERRVAAALAASGLPHLGELQHRVLHDRELFADVLDSLTVRVSDLFRDPALYRCLRARVVPLLRTYPLLKIWHAGCARGEEAYSSAILLHEEGLHERTQIYATDLNQRAVDCAKDGVYPATSAAAFAENHAASGSTASLEPWLIAAYDRIAMCDALRRSILFFQHDLIADHVFGEMHVVFCRNVLMYFRPELRLRVLEKIAGSLVPGGFLCLGAGERLPGDGAVPRKFEHFGDDVYRFVPESGG